MEKFFLIGYMGAGKTTLGKILAKKKGLHFIDLDLFIESRYQKTIRQMFDDIGEARFREIESAILREVSEFENVVISTGGGTPCFSNNIDYMNDKGTTIYLWSSSDALAKRLNKCKASRPLLKDKNEEELRIFVQENLDRRNEFYSKAHIIFETDEFETADEADRFVSKLIIKLDTNNNSL